MIDLPKKDKEGISVFSYSQYKLWKDAKGFGSSLSGKQCYIQQYFLGIKDEGDRSFADFGCEVENFVTKRENSDKFSEEERRILETIEPLGVFQHEIKLRFDGFYIKGFIDDASPDFRKCIDYKTCSEKSCCKFYEDEYMQLDLYALAIRQEHGFVPELEVCAIERTGNAFRGGREVLKVGKNVWRIPRETSEERLKWLSEDIVRIAEEISAYYQVFKKINKV